MITDREWNDGSEPQARGWYAIHYCWDNNEGSFVGADWWDGTWKARLPVFEFQGPFEREDDADEWARSHDISF